MEREIKMNQNIIVTERSATLRALGRSSLRGKWGLAALSAFIYLLLSSVPPIILEYILPQGVGEVSWVEILYTVLISGPLTLGITTFMISLFRRKETSPLEVFYGFEKFGKSFRLLIVMIFFIILWTILLVIPGIIAGYRYSMAFYILADHPDMGVMDILKESKRMTKGNKWKFFCLNLSFFGWGLLAAIPSGILNVWAVMNQVEGIGISILSLIANIGNIWVLPYILVSTVAFYDIANGSLKSASNSPNEWKLAPEEISSETVQDQKKEENRVNPLEDMKLSEPEASNPLEDMKPTEPDKRI